MIIPKARKDKSSKNIRRIKNNIKLILVKKISDIDVLKTPRFKIAVAILNVIEWRLKDRVYRYLKTQEILEAKYKQGKMSWFKYQLKLFINWFNYRVFKK